jgi:serine/threonine protein kinase
LNSVKADVKGGTRCYQAPELFKRKAKFSRKADVFASGVIFLELLTMHGPNELSSVWWPRILGFKLPPVLLKCLEESLTEDPAGRKYFEELMPLLTTGKDSILKLGTFVLREETIGTVSDGDSSYYDSNIYSDSRLAKE